MIADKQLDEAIRRMASCQPIRVSKQSIAEAIIRRAMRMPPDEFDAWLRETDAGEASRRHRKTG